MAKHLDLEEQEQLDALKHFWERWGNLITWLLIAVLGAYAGWTGWQYWQRQQGAAASAIYEEMSRSVAAGDVARVERTLADMKDKYGSTTYAAQGALLVYVAIIIFYARYMNRLDNEYGVEEGEEE